MADLQLRLTPLEDVFLTITRKAELEHAQVVGLGGRLEASETQRQGAWQRGVLCPPSCMPICPSRELCQTPEGHTDSPAPSGRLLKVAYLCPLASNAFPHPTPSSPG